MQSTLTPKPSDDPHDVVVVAPDAIRVAPSDDELSNLLHQAARSRLDTQIRAASDFPAGPTVPPVDTTFRPASVNDILVPDRWPMVTRALRAFMALLLAACIGLAAVAWKSYGDVAKRKIAKLVTEFALSSTPPPEEPAPAAQLAAAVDQADAADAAPPQPAASAQSAAEAVPPAAASPGSVQSLQSMARDLASLGQEMEQLKASIEQLKANQPQISRDAARPPEQNPRPKLSAMSAPPPRPAVARPRKPAPFPTQAAIAPASPQAPASYYVPRQPDYAPRQIEPQPQPGAQTLADPELASVPRPPMPLR